MNLDTLHPGPELSLASIHQAKIHTFSKGLNVTGTFKLVPELKIIGCGYFVVKNLVDGILQKTKEMINNILMLKVNINTSNNDNKYFIYS